MTDIENRDGKRPDTQRPDTQRTDSRTEQTEKPETRSDRPETRSDRPETRSEKLDQRPEKPVGAPAVPPPSAAPAPARSNEARPSSDQSPRSSSPSHSSTPSSNSSNAAQSSRSSQSSHGIALLAQDERDKLTLRLQHAVTGFVDGPQESVEEADRVLAEVTERFTEAVERTRRTVRGSWQSAGGADSGHSGDTEKLRLALRDYRELTERLLHS